MYTLSVSVSCTIKPTQLTVALGVFKILSFYCQDKYTQFLFKHLTLVCAYVTGLGLLQHLTLAPHIGTSTHDI